MKIMIWCQHLLGMGHFFRTLEIARALYRHQVLLVTGGAGLPVRLPGHVRLARLPGLMADDRFSSLFSVDQALDTDLVMAQRRQMLLALAKKEQPDILLVEFFPFGRKAFGKELIPLLEYLAARGGCRVYCSVRDILVEKKDPAAYEKRINRILNPFFHGLLVHSDSKLLPLSLSMSCTDQIKIPVHYTGFISPVPDPEKSGRIRRKLGAGPGRPLVLVSAGSGSVGKDLLQAACQALPVVKSRGKACMVVVTGPYMAKSTRRALAAKAGKDFRVYRFFRDFISLVGAADLSVSMGGYNTIMNAMAAGVPCLALPFDQNREQGLRLCVLARHTGLAPLDARNLAPEKLGLKIREVLGMENRHNLDLSGAFRTAAILEQAVS